MTEAEELALAVEVPTWPDIVFRALPARAEDEAIVFPDARHSYGSLAEAIVRRARSLLALGVQRGDKVGILMPNCMAYVELLFATAAIGAVAVVINARYRAYEFRHVLANAEIKVLLTGGRVTDGPDFVERLQEAFPDLAGGEAIALADLPSLRRMVVFGEDRPGFLGEAGFDGLAARVPAAEVHQRRLAIGLRDPFLIMYTSGTTSLPKGCVLSHEAVVRTSQVKTLRFQLTDADRYWSPLPLFHLGGLNPLGAILLAGGTFLCAPRFEAREAVSALVAERATIAFFAFPAIINDVVAEQERAQADMSGIRAIMSSAAVQPEPVREKLVRLFPNAVQIGTYGMTESAGTISSTAVYDRPGAGLERVGRVAPGMEIRILSEDGETAPTGTIGEIAIRGFALFEGYYNDPAATAAAMRDGWLMSGDLGSFNEHEELMFHGRSKDMFKVGGENVAAAEIEAFVATHPAVKMCQVVAMADARLGEVAAAFVELEAGQNASEEELIAHCRGQLSAFKVPRAVRFVSEWPLTASSKVQKAKLSALLAADA